MSLAERLQYKEPQAVKTSIDQQFLDKIKRDAEKFEKLLKTPK